MADLKKSKELLELEKRVWELEKHFKFKQSITGLTSQQADKLRGLRILCHAEFEDYLESIANNLLDEAEQKWDLERNANYNLSALFITHNEIQVKKEIDCKAKKIIADFKGIIKNNNGIKEKDVKSLFEPLGYCREDFDVVFLASLDSFGSLRGEIAHTSARRTRKMLDQKTEVTTINQLLSGFTDFEKVIRSKKGI